MPVATATSNYGKAEIRGLIRSVRANRSTTEIAEADARRTARLARRLAAAAPAVVAVYGSLTDEPDTSVLIQDLADQGTTVLLPAMVPGQPSEVAWTAWTSESPEPPSWGAETTGDTRGPEALAEANLIILPGLAGTNHGLRLGRGGGWYDRALLQAQPGVPRWLLLYDDEILPDLPAEQHDQLVTALVTERRWIDCSPA